jgi:hypothetical protein
LLVQRKDRGDPPYFLRDLTGHYVRHMFRAKPVLREVTP